MSVPAAVAVIAGLLIVGAALLVSVNSPDCHGGGTASIHSSTATFKE